MFEHTSRYYGLPTLAIKRPDGRVVTYAARRTVPQPDSMTTLLEVRLTEGERLDMIAAATLGASELFWQICDANDAANPFDLAARTGEAIRVPMPAPQSL